MYGHKISLNGYEGQINREYKDKGRRGVGVQISKTTMEIGQYYNNILLSGLIMYRSGIWVKIPKQNYQ